MSSPYSVLLYLANKVFKQKEKSFNIFKNFPQFCWDIIDLKQTAHIWSVLKNM